MAKEYPDELPRRLDYGKPDVLVASPPALFNTASGGGPVARERRERPHLRRIAIVGFSSVMLGCSASGGGWRVCGERPYLTQYRRQSFAVLWSCVCGRSSRSLVLLRHVAHGAPPIAKRGRSPLARPVPMRPLHSPDSLRCATTSSSDVLPFCVMASVKQESAGPPLRHGKSRALEARCVVSLARVCRRHGSLLWSGQSAGVCRHFASWQVCRPFESWQACRQFASWQVCRPFASWQTFS